MPTFLALIGDIGGPELIVIMFIVLLLFGANRLPELARGLGKSVREFKKATSGVENEIRRALEEEPPAPQKKPVATVPQSSPPSPAPTSSPATPQPQSRASADNPAANPPADPSNN